MTSSANITGGCLCGSIRFRVSRDLGVAAYCHCADCRRCTGSAFNVSVGVGIAAFALVSGAPKTFTKTADSGSEVTRHFCPDCGSPLYTSSPRHPDRLYVKAGAFDDPGVIEPAYQSWLDQRVGWSQVPAGLSGYAKGRPPEQGAPPDRDRTTP